MATSYDIAVKQADPEQDGLLPVVAVENVYKSFAGHRVLNGITLRVHRGETLAVLGRSGTGKSVLLRLIIGLEKPDSGSVSIHGQNLAGLGLDRMGEVRKKMGFLFQSAALYDSLTVQENVAFPLEHHRRDMSKSERADRVRQLLAEVGLDGDIDKMPSDISGGMQKRVGLARALVLEPEILLLDEPFATLDAQTRIVIENDVTHICRAGRRTMLLVTHDIAEAISMADRVVVLSKRPASMKAIFDVPFSRGANSVADVPGMAEFSATFRKIWEALEISVPEIAAPNAERTPGQEIAEPGS